MERETKIITTPIGNHKVELKTYLSGRENRQIRNVYLEGADLKLKVGADMEGSINKDLVNKAENMTIETMVIRVNEQTDNILDIILDMHNTDFDYIIAQINAITNPEKDKKK